MNTYIIHYVEYLVLWDGYPKAEASWVAAEDVTSAIIRQVQH